MRRDKRLAQLNIDEKAQVLEAWFKLKVVPSILAPNESLAE